MDLKAHSISLHKQMGATEAQATYHTLIAAKEFTALEPCVTKMVQDGQPKKNDATAMQKDETGEDQFSTSARDLDTNEQANKANNKRHTKRDP